MFLHQNAVDCHFEYLNFSDFYALVGGRGFCTSLEPLEQLIGQAQYLISTSSLFILYHVGYKTQKVFGESVSMSVLSCLYSYQSERLKHPAFLSRYISGP